MHVESKWQEREAGKKRGLLSTQRCLRMTVLVMAGFKAEKSNN